MSEPHQPKGFLFDVRISSNGMLENTEFKNVEYLLPRDRAMISALRYLRESPGALCLIFVRLDGVHESWHIGDLENWAGALVKPARLFGGPFGGMTMQIDKKIITRLHLVYPSPDFAKIIESYEEDRNKRSVKTAVYKQLAYDKWEYERDE